MRSLVFVALAACHSTPAAKPTVGDVPEVRFAMAVGNTVQIIRTTSGGLVVERKTPVPTQVSRILWVGPDPAVWLDMSNGMNGEGFPNESFGNPVDPPGPHQNEMGFVTDTGYRKLAPIEWPPAKPPTGEFAEDMSPVTEDNIALVASKNAIWQKKCRWYGGPDGGWCGYEYARRYPAPVTFMVDDAVQEDHRYDYYPKVAASPTVTIAHATRLINSDGDPEDFNNKQEILRCTPKGGAPIEYPPPGETESWVDQEMHWLSTEPPVFRITEAAPYVGVGRVPPATERIFESCSLSKRYSEAAGGPDGIVVLAGDEVTVLWNGREIGHFTRGGDHVVFAPR